MKEIVTGACLLAVSAMMTALFLAHMSNEGGGNKVSRAIFGMFLFLAAITFGFSGCGIFIRGVIR